MVNKLNNLIMDKKMYKKPATETISIEMGDTCCDGKCECHKG